MKKLAIIGAGDLGQLIAYHAISDKHYKVIGFFDDICPINSIQDGTPVLGRTDEIENFYNKGDFDFIMIGIGYNHMGQRKKLFESLLGKVPFGKIVHSSAFIDSSVELGDGVFILPRCVLDRKVILKNNILLNTATTIAHDTTIESHCFISPCVNIAGKVHIKESCILGINATVIDHILIEKNVRIGASALVVNNILEPGVYFGLPAKKR